MQIVGTNVLLVQRVGEGERLPLPAYQTEQAAGFDLLAAIPEEISLLPGERRLIPNGIRIALPEGYEAQVRPRSGLALKKGLTVLNSPGTIDADYRGEVGTILVNLGQTTVTVCPGDRVSQMVIAPVCRVRIEEAADLSRTSRGEGGFGSSGV